MSTAEKLYIAESSEKSLARGYLRLALAASLVVSLVAVIGCVLSVRASGQRHAYIVRIEPDGRTEAVVEGFQFKRQPAEVEWFLRGFCSHFFSRNKSTISLLRPSRLYFAPGLSEQIDAAWKDAKTVENTLASPTQVDATATEIHMTREGNEAYITVRLDRTINGQKSEPQSYNTYVRFNCRACDGLTVDHEVAEVNPLGFEIQNIPTLEAAK